MLSECRIVACLAITKPQEAKRFYGDVLGLRFIQDHPSLIIYDAAGTTLHLQKVEAFTPHPFTALGWSVPDIHAAIRELSAKGVVFERFTGMDQDEDGVWTPPGSTTGVCWFKDPEGNLLSLSQSA